MSTTIESTNDLHEMARDWADAIAYRSRIAAITKSPNGSIDHIDTESVICDLVKALGSERFHRLKSDARLATLESLTDVRDQLEEAISTASDIGGDMTVKVRVRPDTPLLTNYDIEIEGHEDIVMRCLLDRQGMVSAVYNCSELC